MPVLADRKTQAGAAGQGVAEVRPPGGPQRRHHRHRRPAPDRRGPDEGAGRGREGGRAPRGAAGGRRHDRPGGGQRGQGLRRPHHPDRPRADQARRRCPGRGGDLGPGGHRQADQVRRSSARASTTWTSSIPTGWRPGSSAWATCSPSSRRRSRPTTRSRPRPRWRRCATASFDLDDFLDQLQQLRKMGPLQQLVSMLPGAGQMLRDVDIDERNLSRVEAIIRSMTPVERRDPRASAGVASAGSPTDRELGPRTSTGS